MISTLLGPSHLADSSLRFASSRFEATVDTQVRAKTFSHLTWHDKNIFSLCLTKKSSFASQAWGVYNPREATFTQAPLHSDILVEALKKGKVCLCMVWPPITVDGCSNVFYLSVFLHVSVFKNRFHTSDLQVRHETCKIIREKYFGEHRGIQMYYTYN